MPGARFVDMLTMNVRRARRHGRAAVIVLALCAAAAPVGCMPSPQHAPPALSGPAGTYAPLYYDGYVVYYDGAGRPYHWDDGAIVWISTASPFYGTLTDYWARHRDAYERWYERYGYRYRDFRIAHDGGLYKDRSAQGGFW